VIAGIGRREGTTKKTEKDMRMKVVYVNNSEEGTAAAQYHFPPLGGADGEVCSLI
jgi:hypothetical protein